MKRWTIAYEGLEDKHLEVLNERWKDADVSWIPLQAPADESLAQADVVVLKDLRIPSERIRGCERLRLVVLMDPGQAAEDEAVFRGAGVACERIHWPSLVGVAEHTLIMMLALVKKFVGSVERTRTNQYPETLKPQVTNQTDYAFNWTNETGLGVLYRRTLGVVGMGWIGRQVAQRAAGFGMTVIYTDPNRLTPEEEQRLGVTHVSFDELLRQSDFVSLHTRLSSKTERMIDAGALEQMKSSAFLINTARGRLVDEEALVEALQEGRIAGAGLDVFWKEPMEPESPLLTMENVLVTPHDAGIFIGDAAEMVGGYIADAVEAQFENDEEKKG